ncbi:MAG: sulfate transporter, periplasmic sulfate-binding protein [Gemmataceae bacterium]|nr:sulfate transporter, periplasmic sulfate-binding protein [Gemmataceae bacterium]
MNRSVLRATVLLAAAATVSAGDTDPKTKPAELVNVSDNHAPDLWKEINERFQARQPGVAVKQSVAVWSKQRDLVAKGEIQPDVVALGTGTDLSPLQKANLIPADWRYRLPHRANPFGTFIVFVVPRGNPKGVKDWPDLAKEGVRVLNTNPKGSRTGRHSFLAAYGSVRQRGGSEDEARAFVTTVYQRAKLPAPVIRPAGEPAPAEAPAFLPTEPGDVLLNWEKESLDAVKKSDGKLEIVYPPISIRGENPVAVASNAAAKGTEKTAEAYAKFLYSDEVQELAARHGYRPVRPGVLRKVRPDAPEVELFDARDLFPDVLKAHEALFGEGGVFEQIRGKAK